MNRPTPKLVRNSPSPEQIAMAHNSDPKTLGAAKERIRHLEELLKAKGGTAATSSQGANITSGTGPAIIPSTVNPPAVSAQPTQRTLAIIRSGMLSCRNEAKLFEMYQEYKRVERPWLYDKT